MVACEPEERRGVGSGHCVVAAVISPINFSGEPFLLQLGVPVVLDVVVRSSGQLRCYDRPPNKTKQKTKKMYVNMIYMNNYK